MTRIDFHTNVPDKLAYCCRLVRKAYSGGHKVVVMARDPEQLAALDNALWTFSDIDFLPHVRLGDAQARMTPIVLADNDQQEPPHHELLVNLSGTTPAYFARFERMFEIIDLDETEIRQGRERYAFYKQRGYPLHHFVAESVA